MAENLNSPSTQVAFGNPFQSPVQKALNRVISSLDMGTAESPRDIISNNSLKKSIGFGNKQDLYTFMAAVIAEEKIINGEQRARIIDTLEQIGNDPKQLSAEYDRSVKKLIATANQPIDPAQPLTKIDPLMAQQVLDSVRSVTGINRRAEGGDSKEENGVTKIATVFEGFDPTNPTKQQKDLLVAATTNPDLRGAIEESLKKQGVVTSSIFTPPVTLIANSPDLISPDLPKVKGLSM